MEDGWREIERVLGDHQGLERARMTSLSTPPRVNLSQPALTRRTSETVSVRCAHLREKIVAVAGENAWWLDRPRPTLFVTPSPRFQTHYHHPRVGRRKMHRHGHIREGNINAVRIIGTYVQCGTIQYDQLCAQDGSVQYDQ